MGSPPNPNPTKNEEVVVSKSRKYVEYLTRVLDYVSWVIIAIFVYIWWTTRGSGVDCTYETCQALYQGLSCTLNTNIRGLL